MKVILLMMKMAENEVTSFEDDFLNPADDVVEVVIVELKSQVVATVTEGDLERDKDFFYNKKNAVSPGDIGDCCTVAGVGIFKSGGGGGS